MHANPAIDGSRYDDFYREDSRNQARWPQNQAATQEPSPVRALEA